MVIDVTIAMVLIALISMIIAMISFVVSRKDKGSDKFTDLQTGLIKANVKLDQLCTTTNETRNDVKSLGNRISALEAEMASFKIELTSVEKDVEDLKQKAK